MNHHVSLLRWIVRNTFRGAVIPVPGETGALWIRPAEYPSLLLGPRRAEPDIAREWRALLRPSEIIFDVGANIGFTAQRFHSLLGGRCRIHAFEPLARNVELLRRNVAKLGDAVSVEAVAVGDHDGTAVLSDNRHHGGLSRLQGLAALRPEHTPFWTAAADVEVPLISLDSFVARNPDARPSFLKLDVEGAGHWVMRGAHRVLAESRPLVSCSFHSTEERAGILEVLQQHGYRGISVDGAGRCEWRGLDDSGSNFLHPSDTRQLPWLVGAS